MDEAVEALRSQGIEAIGIVCHVAIAEQRKNLINKTLEVRHVLLPRFHFHSLFFKLAL